MKRLFIWSALLCALLTSVSLAQHKLQFDAPGGRYGILQLDPAAAVGVTFYTFPPGSGTVVTTVTLPTLAWVLGGNSAPFSNILGTLDPTDVRLFANNAEKLRLVAGGDASFYTNAVPSANNTYTLGTDANRWADVFVGGASVHIGTALATEMDLGYAANVGTINVDAGTAEIQINGVTGNVGIGAAPAAGSVLRVHTGGSGNNISLTGNAPGINFSVGPIDGSIGTATNPGDWSASAGPGDFTVRSASTSLHLQSGPGLSAITIDAANDVLVRNNLNINGILTGTGSGHSLGTLTVDANVLTINGDANNVGAYELDVQGDLRVTGVFSMPSLTPNAVVVTDGAGNLITDNPPLSYNAVTNILSTEDFNIAATTSATAGVITQAGVRLLHTYTLNNLFVGLNSGNFTLTGTNDVGVGPQTLTNVTTGSQNTALGAHAMVQNTTGDANTAVGYNALNLNTTGGNNTAVGLGALDANVGGSGNVAVGQDALGSNVGGGNSVALGFEALMANTTAGNSAMGSQAMRSNTTGQRNVGIGIQSMLNMNSDDNTAVGAFSLRASAGGQNTAVGKSAMQDNTGANNTAVGFNSLAVNTANDNTAVGYGSLDANTTGSNNSAVGRDALGSNTTGPNNTAVGYTALAANTSGNTNTAVGSRSLDANTTGNSNTAIGFDALTSSSTTNGNTAVGYQAMQANTTGNENTAVGTNAMAATTTGSANVAVGNATLLVNTTGGGNVAIGDLALTANTTGSTNTAVGRSAMISNTTGVNNVAMGIDALHDNVSSNGNTALGNRALLATTGGTNTGVGDNAGDNNLTGSNNTFVGASADASANNLTNATAIGANAVVSASNSLVLGSGANVGIGDSDPAALFTVGAGDDFQVSSTGVMTATAANGHTLGDGTSAHQLNISGTVDALVTDALASATWDLAVTGDIAASGIIKSGASMALDGVSATRRLWSDDALNIVTVLNDITMTPGGGDVMVTGNIIPTADNTYALGSATNAWSNVYATTITLPAGSYPDDAVFYSNAGALDAEAAFNYNDATNTLNADIYNTISTGNYRIGGTSVLSNNFVNSVLSLGPTSAVAGTNNTFLGNGAGNASALDANTVVGQGAWIVGGAGSNNTFIGTIAGYAASGNNNTAVGVESARNSTGNDNTYLGYRAGYHIALGGPTASSNTMIGAQTGAQTTTGANNVFVGWNAGSANTTGSSNTYVGYQAGGAAAITNATAIGNGANVTASNTIQLGDAGVTTVISSGDITMTEANSVLTFTGDAAGVTTIAAGNQGATNVNYTLPIAQATAAGQVLSNDGTGVLSWSSSGGTAVTHGVTSPAAIAGNTNDYGLVTATATHYRISSTGAFNITGIVAAADGRVIIITNVGANNITLTHLDAGSAAANQFRLPGGANITLGADGAATLIYDATTTKWRVVSTN